MVYSSQSQLICEGSQAGAYAEQGREHGIPLLTAWLSLPEPGLPVQRWHCKGGLGPPTSTINQENCLHFLGGPRVITALLAPPGHVYPQS